MSFVCKHANPLNGSVEKGYGEKIMKLKYKVYDGHSPEAQIMWLTDSQASEYRRQGYYVTECH